MSVNLGLWEQTSNLSGLSPPSESRLMQRRKSVHNSQSLQLNRINSAGSKVLSIQVRVRISLHFPVYLVKLLTVLPGPDWPSTHRISVLLTPPVAAVGLQFFYTSLPFVPKALRSPFGTQLYLRRQRLYYNMRNWIMAVLYMSTTLYIVKMQNNIYFWGQPLSMIWGATVPLQMKIIFNFF